MTTRGTGKSRSSAKSQVKTRKKANSKKTKTKTKPRPKTKTQKKKKKRTTVSRKKGALWARIRSNLIYLLLGLAAGILGAILILYFSGAFKTPLRWGTAVSPPAKETGSVPHKPLGATHKAYEENNRLDKQTKKIDQALYRVLSIHKVPEKDIHFVEITQRRTEKSEWHHATIEVQLPEKVKPDELTKDFKVALHGLSLDPPPRMSVSQKNRTMHVKVRFDGLLTHTLLLQTIGETESPPLAPPTPFPGPRPKVAIVIDDFGLARSQAQCFLKLKIPLTLAILPFQEYSQEVAREAHKLGRAVMLHMPMEPAQYPLIYPGEGALLVSMSREEIQVQVREAIKNIPYIVGVNNHMGSRFTENAERMSWLLEEIKKHNLYFLDSRTSVRTQAYAMAKRMGVKTAERAVFLDNVQEAEAIRIQIRRLIALARQRGQAIAIGHPYPITCQVLKKEYNHLKSKVELVPITSLLK
ncbi:MAG: divergent polysaccharide deacetylase family protein [Deltaproteobacteria bacterium]|nr:divergent polysaccharide deacetylase family protein [Deltaproteobacteria bacterium]MBW2141138.1 divergent polysaccharide deacetylase family protein [Deltaproteobacteria bacterium]